MMLQRRHTDRRPPTEIHLPLAVRWLGLAAIFGYVTYLMVVAV